MVHIKKSFKNFPEFLIIIFLLNQFQLSHTGKQINAHTHTHTHTSPI